MSPRSPSVAAGSALRSPPMSTDEPIRQMSAVRAAGGVAARVVQQLQAYIERNSLKPGDKLPPERVFIEQFGVSRSSLREAIRVLSTLRLVEVRHGDGMYVGAGAHHASQAAIFDATEEHALRNLIETRLGVELAATTAATTRATEEDFERLHQLVEAQLRGLENDPPATWEPLAFELAVAEVSGNTWLYNLELMLRDAWLSLSRGLRSSVSRYTEWGNEHRAILASMRSRNVPQVQRLLTAHLSLERFEEDLRSRHDGAARRQQA